MGILNNRIDRIWGIIVLALLISAALRWQAIAPLSDTLLFDEAAYALDALSLIENPRLQVYFPDNYGREGLWMAVLTPSLLIFGAEPFALRLTAAMIGILTTAAVGRLGLSLFGRRGAALSALSMAVFYWHVHLSHIGFRAILLPLFGALALTALLHALRHNRRWGFAGLLIGLTAYTYSAALMWVGLFSVILLVVGFKHKRAWGALILSVIVALPLIIALVNQPPTRAVDVAVSDVTAILDNARLWLGAWFGAGDAYPVHNLPERPIWDLPFALLSLIGLAGLITRVRSGWYALLIVALLGVALIPSLLTVDAPHMLRTIGATVPLAIIAASGALIIVDRVPRIGWLIAAGLIGWAGVNTAIDFARAVPMILDFTAQERGIITATASSLQTDRAMIAPYPHDHPLIRFAGYRQPPAIVTGFDPGYCRVYDRDGAQVISVSQSDFHRATLSDYATLTPITHPSGAAMWQVMPVASLLEQESAILFDGVQVIVISDLPAMLTVGESVTVDIALRGHDRAELNLALQVLTTQEGDVTLSSNDDRRLCEPYPTSVWLPDDIIVQTFTLSPSVSGTHRVEIAVYDSVTNTTRLTDTGQSRVVIGTITVTE